jgi:hypothetical protein
MARPVEFLQGLRRTIGERPTALFFEVPNSLYTLADLGVWDHIYEHCGYFWAGSLAAAFRRAGFRPTRLTAEFGGQYLTIDAVPGGDAQCPEPAPAEQGSGSVHPRPSARAPAAKGARAGEPSLDGLCTLVGRFADAYRMRLAHWQGVLDALRRDGRRAVLWGAGSKGVSFVNALRAGDAIDCLVDLNPHKHGRFVPGTGHEVRGPDALAARPPDAVIVMNPLYAEEIGTALRAMGIEAELLVEGTA